MIYNASARDLVIVQHLVGASSAKSRATDWRIAFVTSCPALESTPANIYNRDSDDEDDDDDDTDFFFRISRGEITRHATLV
jgi:hypothetical protein